MTLYAFSADPRNIGSIRLRELDCEEEAAGFEAVVQADSPGEAKHKLLDGKLLRAATEQAQPLPDDLMRDRLDRVIAIAQRARGLLDQGEPDGFFDLIADLGAEATGFDDDMPTPMLDDPPEAA